jgi:hypothetical protein
MAMFRFSPSGFAARWNDLAQYEDTLTIWFWAAYLMTTDKRGISALRSRNIP